MPKIGKRPSKEVLEDLYTNKCMNLREIGDVYGVSRQRVQQWIDTYEIERIHSQVNNKLDKHPPISKQALRCLIDTGNKITTISKKTGISLTSIKYLINRYHLEDRYNEMQKRINFKFENMPDRKTIEKLYSSDISVRKIFEILNCSESTFYKWVDFYGIKRKYKRRIKRWNIEIDDGNYERYICPYCGEENDWESPHCPMCGRKLRSSEEIEEAKGLKLRKDIPDCMCLRDDCMFNQGGVCAVPPNPYEMTCSKYTSITAE